jgi:hypothetical protein
MYPILEHPEITRALRTGYPSWMQEDEGLDYEYCADSAYEEGRERDLFGEE